MNINPAVVDISLEASGFLGAHEDPDNMTFGASFPRELVIRESDWRARYEANVDFQNKYFPGSDHYAGSVLAHYNSYVFNQHPESSCVANATCGVIQRLYNKQLSLRGKYQVILSPMSLYARIGASRHSGAYMMDGLKYTSIEHDGNGVLPSSGHGQDRVFEHTSHENTPYYTERNLPNGYTETGYCFRVKKWARLTDIGQIASCGLQQIPLVFGREGHSMCAEDLIYDDGEPYMRVCDSYGRSARDGTGRVYDSRRKWQKWINNGCWAALSVERPDDPRYPCGQEYAEKYGLEPLQAA